jgi:two-component system response regulator NreC
VCPVTQNEQDQTIRCVVAHDIAWLRQGVRRLLDDEHRGSRPPHFEGTAVQTERLIVRESPASKVLFLTNHDEESRGDDLADSAYAVRRTSAEELVGMVRKTAAIEGTASAQRSGAEIAEWPLNPAPRRRDLTAREREILKLLAEGQTVRSAANILGLSSKTVDAHKFNLMRKLGVHNKAELVMWAIQSKIVKLPASF